MSDAAMRLRQWAKSVENESFPISRAEYDVVPDIILVLAELERLRGENRELKRIIRSVGEGPIGGGDE